MKVLEYDAELAERLLDDAVLNLGSARDDIKAASHKYCGGKCILLMALAAKIESNKNELVELIRREPYELEAKASVTVQ